MTDIRHLPPYIGPRYHARPFDFAFHKDSGVGVKDLCLGALTFGDASGYDIKKFFPQSFSRFYAAGYGSIYPALTELTVADLVGCLHKRAAPGRTASSIALRSRDHVAFARGLPATQPR